MSKFYSQTKTMSMKKLQFFSLLLGLVFGSLAFVACGDDDDDNNTPKATTATLADTKWYEEQTMDGKFLNYVTYIFDNAGHVSFGNLDNNGADKKWHKWTRHTYDYTVSGENFSWTQEGHTSTGTYSISVNGDILTIKMEGNSRDIVVKRMTGDVLNWYNNAIEGFEGYSEK